jgi:hypothetical protein
LSFLWTYTNTRTAQWFVSIVKVCWYQNILFYRLLDLLNTSVRVKSLNKIFRINPTNARRSRGLNADEAANRLTIDGRNILIPLNHRNNLQLYLHQFTEIFRLLLLLSAALCFLIFFLDRSAKIELYFGIILCLLVIVMATIAFIQHKQGFKVMMDKQENYSERKIEISVFHKKDPDKNNFLILETFPIYSIGLCNKSVAFYFNSILSQLDCLFLVKVIYHSKALFFLYNFDLKIFWFELITIDFKFKENGVSSRQKSTSPTRDAQLVDRRVEIAVLEAWKPLSGSRIADRISTVNISNWLCSFGCIGSLIAVFA